MRIGDISKLMSIRPETVRYYEKEGLLHPDRKTDSTYREYSIWDIFDLTECRKYREMDFSIKDVRRLKLTENLDGIRALLALKHKEILTEANHKLLLAAEVKELKDRIENARLNIGNYWFGTEPEKIGIFFTERTGKEYSGIDLKDSVIRQWLKDNLYLQGYMFVSPKDLEEGIDRNKWAYVLTRSAFDFLGLPEERSFVLESRSFLHTIIDIGEKESLSLDMLKPTIDYLKDKDLSVGGDIIGYLMIRCYENGSYHRYVEVMIPVEYEWLESRREGKHP